MKKTRFLSLFIIIIFSMFFLSCVTKALPIPGDTNKQINNIYIEYMNIADIFYSEEKYDKAITYYELAMQNKKLYWDCYYKLAKSYAYQSNWGKSEEMFQVLLKRDPENFSLKQSLAYINAMSGNVDKALIQYEELMQLQPNNSEFLVNYIAVILLNQRLDDVLVPFMALKNHFPDDENIEKFQKQIDSLVEKIEKEKNHDIESDDNDKSTDSENEDNSDDDFDDKYDDDFNKD